jgi:mRNA interferase HigB
VILVNREKIERFARKHPQSREPLRVWQALIEANQFAHFADLKKTFAAVDYAKPFTIFDIKENNVRLVALVMYSNQVCTITRIMTHDEYTRWNKERR